MDGTVSANEAARLDTLARYNVLDTPDEAAFDRITRIAAQLAGTPIALISLVDVDRQWFKSRHGLDVRETPRDIAFCAHAIRGNAPLIVDDATEDRRFQDNPLVTGDFHLRFYAGVPLRMLDGQAIGTLCAIDRTPRTLTQAQIDSLADLARLVADELELRQIATTDSLTGAFTRRFLDGLLETELARCQRYGNPLSVIAIDLDHFKTVNDTHGHAAGDVWLQAIVALLKQTLRRVDAVARVGGEEFLVVLPETPAEGATVTAGRLRAAIAALRVPFGQAELTGTASLGVTSHIGSQDSVTTLLQRADAALYAAKHEGRNRVICRLTG